MANKKVAAVADKYEIVHTFHVTKNGKPHHTVKVNYENVPYDKMQALQVAHGTAALGLGNR